MEASILQMTTALTSTRDVGFLLLRIPKVIQLQMCLRFNLIFFLVEEQLFNNSKQEPNLLPIALTLSLGNKVILET